ncbi:chorion peroxidase [Cylas formicarius]|uniref:chorion peroxidase n=1 Tax=Cylas formicarius TaxID=197179 RepID=UPI00295872B8|nr:chorion peroxidase [Cylas formicarius]
MRSHIVVIIAALARYVACHVARDARDVLIGSRARSPCVAYVSCPAHVTANEPETCTINGRFKGVRCATGQNHTGPVATKDRGHHHLRLDKQTLGALNKKTKAEMSKLRSREAELMREAAILLPGPATYGHFRNSRTFDASDLSEVVTIANNALEIAIATRAFKDRQGLTNRQLEMGLTHGEDLRPTSFGHACVTLPYCPLVPDKYRRIDGACNNVLHSTWGAPFTPYSRLLPPSYEDGVWSPRVSRADGSALPSPRSISTTIISDVDSYNHDFTLLLMQFGQFMSHDLTQSIDTKYGNGSAISCCSADGTSSLPAGSSHYACMPVDLPERDPFYGRFGQRCMNFVRSVLAPRYDCTLGYANQMNKLTHFVDASSVYGSTPEQTSQLRSFRGGKLNAFHDYGRQLLPLSRDPNACLTMEQGSACFESGDTRTNQMISLVVLHTLFLREHNRIAETLGSLNPHWEDEQIFLEARQIVMAEMQVIVYGEFLPAVLGDDALEEFGIRLSDDGEYSYDYDVAVEPSVTNEFAAAALRFGHSIVDGTMKVYGPKKLEEVIAIPEVMFYPARMRQQRFMDEILSTLTTEPIQEVDTFMPDALTKYMFRAGNPFGVDLASINVQRGRDHGLRPYNDYRELVGLERFKDFASFGSEMGGKLASVYKSVDDVDLWVGGLLEPKYPGSLVGPTFRAIIGDQFMRLKRGDRYFFENHPSINPGHFEPEQLRELRRASMSRIICDNSDKILLSRQAPHAFRKPDVPGNEFVDCAGATIPSLDLTPWQE